MCYGKLMNFDNVRNVALIAVAWGAVSLAGCHVSTGSAKNDGSHTTPPPPPPASGGEKQCGGIAGFQCAAGTYCAFTVEQKCGAGDAMGTCKPRPEVCTEQF